MKTFDKYYASYYDLIYQDKDYKKEADYVYKIIKKYLKHASTLLDLGCGTGNHAHHLSKTGLIVWGVDQSEYMIQKALEKKNENLHFLQKDIRKLKIHQKFDVVTSLFHILSYQNSNKDVQSLFKVAFNHLNDYGLFIFDFWYGPAVLTQKPEVRIKEFENDEIKFIRLANPEIDYRKNIVLVHYKILAINKLHNSIFEFSETHSMRYFFDPELEYISERNGFKIKNKLAWLTFNKPTEKDWSVVWILKK